MHGQELSLFISHPSQRRLDKALSYRGLSSASHATLFAMHASSEPTNAQKSRRGLSRLWHAARYSIAGLRAGWNEQAFRMEALFSIAMLPGAFWLGQSWLEVVLLTGTVLLVLITELLNSGIEAAIDRFGPEWHALSKKAKDMGSAAVLLSLLLCAGTWCTAIYQNLIR